MCQSKISKQKIIRLFELAVILTCYVGILLLVNQFKKVPLASTQGQFYEKAVVTEITKDNMQEDGNRYGSQKVVLKILSGEKKGKSFSADSPSGSLFGADCVVGMKVIALLSVSEDTVIATVYAKDRSLSILCFVSIFIGTILLIGGRKGAKAVLSLIFTLVTILGLLFPLIYRGYSPFLTTVLVAAITTVFTIFYVGGRNQKSVVAVIGTVSGVVIAGITAQGFGKIAGISGYNVSDIDALSYLAEYTNVKIGGLLFAGIIISSLGAVMDVGMSMASSMEEIRLQNRDISQKELFLSGIRVGKDMMGTMTNTLILAYVGGSITTLVLNYSYDLPTNQLLNSYNIGIEIMQGLSGSMGIVLTVPITAFLASQMLLQKKSTEEK